MAHGNVVQVVTRTRVKYPAADHISWLEWLALAAIIGIPLIVIVLVVLRWL